MATSRESLRAAGEWSCVLLRWSSPTGYGAQRSERLGFSAIQLFAERVMASLSTFELSDASPMWLNICRRLDGLPLAIELRLAARGPLRNPRTGKPPSAIVRDC